MQEANRHSLYGRLGFPDHINNSMASLECVREIPSLDEQSVLKIYNV